MISPTITVKTSPGKVRRPELLTVLASKSVTVGVHPEKVTRVYEPRKRPPNNAMLAMIHDRGSPLQGIPARPFLQAGIKEGKEKIDEAMKQVVLEFLSSGKVDLRKVGRVARDEVRRKIRRGPFVPLSLKTIRAKRRAGLSRGPLLATWQLYKSIDFMITDKTVY